MQETQSCLHIFCNCCITSSMQIKRHDPFCDRSGRAVLVGFEREGSPFSRSCDNMGGDDSSQAVWLDGNVHHLSINMTSSLDK